MAIINGYHGDVFIELGAISSLIAHLLNRLSNTTYITNDIACLISKWMIRYNVDQRCLWMKCAKNRMDVADKEALLSSLDIPHSYREYLLSTATDAFKLIEDAIAEFIDAWIPRESWDIWAIRDISHTSIQVSNEGDYRALNWAMSQVQDNGEFAQYYPEHVLRSHL